MTTSENRNSPTLVRPGNLPVYRYRNFETSYSHPSHTDAYSLPSKLGNESPDFEKLGIIKTKGPANISFASLDSRLESFHSWPKEEIICSKKLAEAGFYYTGVRDRTMCFYCQIGVENWQSHHDPKVEHSRWVKQCFMMAVNEGKDVDNANGSNTHTMKEITRKQPEKDIGMTLKCFSSPDCCSLKLCCLCQSREKSVVFLPCGHFATCHQCTISLSKCAACKKPFKGLVPNGKWLMPANEGGEQEEEEGLASAKIEQ